MPFPTGIVDALDPSRLRLLVEVERRGSISAAAEACGISQPSATKQLKTLEAAVGEKLVQRNGRASRLTGAGAVVVAHAARVLDTLQGLQEELDALRGAETGTLALAASTTPGTYVLPSILRCFADRHPGVEVDIAIGSSAWVADRVAKREFSLGIAGEIELPDGVRAEPFPADELDRGELESFRVQGADPMRRSTYLLMPDDRDSTPSERAFIATLSDCCAVSVA